MPSFVNGVRSEFTVSDIEYSRDGGWFLTYKKAALLTILVMSLCLFSAYMGRQSTDHVVYVQAPETTTPPEEDKVIDKITFVATDGAKVEIKTVDDENVSKFTRLPQEIVPLHYDLHFMFYESLEHHTYKVEVNVTLQPLVDRLDEIVMHARSLEFDDNIKLVSLKHENKNIKVSLEEVALHRQTIKLKLDENISRSEKYKLQFHITGNIGDGTWDSGVFRGKYTEKDHIEYYMMTKFDPTGARQAFPCFDEPSHKTTFNVTITHSKKYSCLFNTAKTRNVTDSKNEAMTITTFEKTPRMSTYLLSFFIGNLTNESINQTIPHQKQTMMLNIWRRRSTEDKLFYMQEVLPDVVRHFHESFDTPLPLGKIDVVVVPEFNVSAVENWGLVYLRETDCKIDELSSFERKRTLYILIAHNLAHHWLGDLVTFKNWTSVWFYESLVSSAVDNALVKRDLSKPWPNEEMKLVLRKSFALHADSSINTRSIQNNSEEAMSSEDLYGSLEPLTYRKGVSFLDMLKTAVSDHTYNRAIQLFLKSWDLANADEFDFIENMNEVLEKPLVWASNSTSKNLTNVLKTWISTPGFPVVHVTRDEKRRDVVKFKQDWFCYDKPNEEENDKLWYIPITMTTLTNTAFNETARFWLDRREYRYRVHGLEEDSWIIVNLNFGGFYRVNYDLPNWSLLLKEIHRGTSSILSSLTQAHLMDDAFALARNGMLSYEIPLDMTKALKDNSTYVTWATVLNNVRYFKNILIHEKHSKLEEYLRNLMSDVYDHLSYGVSPSYEEELLLSEISEWSCGLSLPACVSKVNKTYHENGYELLKTLYNDQMIGTILCTVVRESPDKEWNILWDHLTTNEADLTFRSKDKDGQIKDSKYPTLLRSLTCSKNHTKVERVLDKLLEESTSPGLSNLWSQMATDPELAILMFSWFRSNWDSKIKEASLEPIVLAKVITGCMQGLTTTPQLLQVKKFLADNSEDDVIKVQHPSFKASMQLIQSKISWRSQHSSSVNSWLRNYVEKHLA